MHKKILYQLLPKGPAFRAEAPGLSSLLEAIAKELDRVSSKAHSALLEIPGTLDEMLSSWQQVLAILPGKSQNARQEAIVSRLAAVGGQSKTYLEAVLKKIVASSYITPIHGKSLLRVYGASIRAKPLRSGEPIGAPLRSYRRNEDLIAALEGIKHAETEALYYNEGEEHASH